MINMENHMKRIITILLLVVCTATIGLTQAKKSGGNPLVGTWKVVEGTSASGEKNSNPQPGLYIFTAKHYSMVAITGTQPRPKYTDQSKATDKEKVAVFDQLQANSGTYTFSGNTLKIRPVVAKNDFVVSRPELEFQVRIDGNNLTVTATNGFNKGVVNKLIRIE